MENKIIGVIIIISILSLVYFSISRDLKYFKSRFKDILGGLLFGNLIVAGAYAFIYALHLLLN